jgi:hypothetical protein
MNEQPAIADLLGLSNHTKIPFWRFAVGLSLRPALNYDIDDVEWLTYNLMHISHLRPDGYGSEDYYAMRKRHDELLLSLAEKAETDEEIDFVLKNLDAFMSKASEVIGEKAMSRRRPKDFEYHERVLKGKNAERSTHLELAKTEDDLWPLLTGPMAESPHFDTVTEPAFRKMIEVTKRLKTLQWICNGTATSYLTDVQFAVAARVYELFKAKELEE